MKKKHKTNKKQRKRQSFSGRIGRLLHWTSVLAGALSLWKYKEKLKKEHRMVMPFGYGYSHVISGSMEPDVKTGDAVIIHKEPDYNVGDVVIYKRKKDSQFIIHRIIKKLPDAYVTKGDANDFEDVPITSDQILGKMVAKTDKPDGILTFLATEQGFACMLCLLSFLLLSGRSKKKNVRDQKKRKK